MVKPLKAKLYVLDGRIIHVGDWDFDILKVTVEETVPDPRTEEYAQVQRAYDQAISNGEDPTKARKIYDRANAKIADHPHSSSGYIVQAVETGETITRNPIPKGVRVIEDGEYLITADEQIVLATDYRALRKAEYPPIHDYLDAVAKDDQKAIVAYKAKCMAVKRKYPKAK